jgi:hypothetical protein
MYLTPCVYNPLLYHGPSPTYTPLDIAPFE